jgi:hypothetical protein
MTNLLERALRYPRAIQTYRSFKDFEKSTEAFPQTDGQAYFNMRSAMDIDPRFGKWLSRRALPGLDKASLLSMPLSATRFADPEEISSAVSGLRRDGFYVFHTRAAAEVVEKLRQFALTNPCTPRGHAADVDSYPRENPMVGRYDFSEEVAFTCPEVREFAADPVTAAIAEAYLGQSVVMDEIAFWWTTTAGAEDTSLNAQEFHQDRDRLSFLKFFIYLTDVTPETGPHVYVRGTHTHVPRALRSDGRKGDLEVTKAGLGEAITEICGPAGTLMAVDTIGLHKGKTPTGGDRLALENEYATSLFGAPYSVIPVYDGPERGRLPHRLRRLCP